MANVPWHQEVVAFVQQLADMLPQYEIACEHEHSNCLLLAHTKVRKCFLQHCSLERYQVTTYAWKDYFLLSSYNSPAVVKSAVTQ